MVGGGGLEIRYKMRSSGRLDNDIKRDFFSKEKKELGPGEGEREYLGKKNWEEVKFLVLPEVHRDGILNLGGGASSL